ncbi:alkyl/aryl-sulfatase [Streptomyces sp. NBC_01669]|uniref:alkyl/aryl-sulfatase n=1 Tax=Streptomyces sp. NBC_01669 TaxID=2975909 RepID=UPI0022546B37|nr:alkyl sulfatase dimerization domain-containing protein [Streptomyces sp. NBC_01669]MCX4537703.1 MBL fold metallo-hydrolase [Streptomyces sp. NBC_01669]
MTDHPELNWDDTTDHANATRGLIDKLDPCVIRDEAGRVVWDNDRWDFLEKDCPETANRSLWRQSRLNALQGLFEVVPGIYQVRGLDISNMTLVEGERGVIVIDPLTSMECAAAGLALYHRHRGDRPVTAVVYTHSHGDHFGGALGVTTAEDVAAGRVPVIAPSGFLEHVGENVFVGPAMSRRAVYMYGSSLPAGPEGMVGFGVAQDISTGTIGLIPPTVTVTETGQEMVFDEVRFVFQLTPDAEAPSEMNFYFPDHRALLVADNVVRTLHNLGTLRGAPVRDARAWADYLTETVRLFGDDAEVLIGSHNWPTWGRAELLRLLSEQRDAYSYIHDQSVRMMNQGLTAAEISEELSELPGDLGRAWHLRGYYGSLSHNTKAVYQRYMGWFDGNPAHLWLHPPVEAGRRYVEFMGGADATVEKARASYDAGDYRWVAEVLNHVVFAYPDHTEARELQARTFEKLAYGAENGTWRNFYLTGAQELRSKAGEGDMQKWGLSGNLHLLAGLSARQIFQLMAVRLNGPRAAAHRLLLRWEFTDSGEVWTLLMANGVLTPMLGDAPGGEAPHLTLRLTRTELNLVLARHTTLADSAIELEGDTTALTTLYDLLETPPRSFAIATP